MDSNLEFNANFLQYVKLFSLIDSCDEDVKTANPEFNGNFLDNEKALSKYRNLVLDCYLHKIKFDEDEEETEEEDSEDEVEISSDKWMCPLCDTINKNTDNMCSNEDCDMLLVDL